MRYTLNDEGYIETISFLHAVECNNKTCTEYTGTIPEGYNSLAEWNEIAVIQAYKIVDGNLTYDPDKKNELEKEWAKDGTEWHSATLSSSFKVYGDNSEVAPEYRRTDKVVEIRGQVAPTTAITSGGTATIFTLPEGYRPSKTVYALCQGSGKNTWLLSVTAGGNVDLGRYGVNANAQCPIGAWLPFSAKFTID
jgi:hypothetical protein